MFHYKDDIVLALELFIRHSRHNKINVNKDDFLNHYCKKFSLSKRKYKNYIYKIYDDYNNGG